MVISTYLILNCCCYNCTYICQLIYCSVILKVLMKHDESRYLVTINRWFIQQLFIPFSPSSPTSEEYDSDNQSTKPDPQLSPTIVVCLFVHISTFTPNCVLYIKHNHSGPTWCCRVRATPIYRGRIDLLKFPTGADWYKTTHCAALTELYGGFKANREQMQTHWKDTGNKS